MKQLSNYIAESLLDTEDEIFDKIDLNIFNIISPKLWISGHYHYYSEEFINNTKLISIGIMEFYNINY
jgi:hypothetical protein